MDKNAIHFKSCFIADIAFCNDDNEIAIVDTSRSTFIIKTSDEDLVNKFKDWFKNTFLSCKPQQVTIIKYRVEDRSEYEVFCRVLDMIYV